jgi:prolipoprotein diacylglyceryltransferase
MHLIGLILFIIATIFWIKMLIHCIKNPALNDTQKIVWVLVILFTHLIGALIYYILVRNQSATT